MLTAAPMVGAVACTGYLITIEVLAVTVVTNALAGIPVPTTC